MKVQAQLTYSHGYFVKFTHTHTHTPVVTGRNEVVAKVMFLLVSVILSMGGVCLSACWDATPQDGGTPQEGDPLPRRPPTMREAPFKREAPQEGDPQEGGTPCQGDPPGRSPPAKETPRKEIPPPGPQPRGKLKGIRSRPIPRGEIDWDQIQAHTQGGNGRGSDIGPHPRAKLRSIRSRPTSKGEIEGDKIQPPFPPEKQTPAYGQ